VSLRVHTDIPGLAASPHAGPHLASAHRLASTVHCSSDPLSPADSSRLREPRSSRASTDTSSLVATRHHSSAQSESSRLAPPRLAKT
jgi:hypothetical protein